MNKNFFVPIPVKSTTQSEQSADGFRLEHQLIYFNTEAETPPLTLSLNIDTSLR
jgi:hypothetical protein